MDNQNNRFGGPWTEEKIDIFIKYLKAYLDIMKNYKFELIYFDGFAGCGEIESENYSTLIEGVVNKVLSIEHDKRFDIYYLVENNKKNALKLNKLRDEKYANIKNVYIIEDDCNIKLKKLSEYLAANKYRRALAFIDPYGLEVNWDSISVFNGLGIDMWILVPTGGVNRMLTKDGRIDESWMKKLIKFLGLTKEEIINYFYKEEIVNTLFEEKTKIIKVNKPVEKVLALYKDRLKTVFKFVSKAYPLVNSKGSIMFHFLMASNNDTAKKIANYIIGKGLKK
jgi:three-Cys-motif partner protein